MIKLLKWTMVLAATWTMLISPVAMGQEAKRVSKQRMQIIFDELGLNRQITLGEFYSKNKHLYPSRVQKEIEPFIAAFKNQLMPSFEVLSSKTTSGEEIATIRMTQGAELLNIQWFGEKDKMFKFQNTTISEIDVINFNDMFTRIIAGDEKFRKQVEPTALKKTSKLKPSAKYPDVTQAEWKSMSAYDRANYVVNLRLLLQDAREVLKAKENSKNKKTSENFFEKNKHFFALFFGQDVEAADKDKAKAKAKVVATGQKSSNYFSGETCIVAGYVARYEKSSSGGEVCNYKVVDQVYANRDNSLYQEAKKTCASSNQVACNPYVFGTPGGAPTCVTPSLSNVSFQKATHWDGPCDSASRLSKNEVNILKNTTKETGRYEDANLMSKAEREELFKTEQGQENYKLTEDYLLGILKFRKKIDPNAKSLFADGVMNDEILAQIKKDKEAFDHEIAEATASCIAESKASQKSARVHEKNYWQACDQLHSRFTFVAELFASKCDKGQTFNPDTLKCICPVGTPAVQNPGLPPSLVAPPKEDAPPKENIPPNTSPVNAPPKENVPANTLPVDAPPKENVPANTTRVDAPPKENVPANTSPVDAPPKENVPANTSPVNAPPKENVPANTSPVNAPKIEVCPGAKCAAATPAPTVPTTVKEPVTEDCAAKYPGATELSDNCLCVSGKAPKLITEDEATGQEAWECESATGGKPAKPKKAECGFWCKLWKGVKAAAPFVIGGIVAYAVFKSLAPKKPKLNPPTDVCPNGQPAPCAQTCTPPLKNQANGTCACDGCPPGQTANPTTCYCSTGTNPPGGGQTYLCPDSTTRVANLTNCPTYACWNGQSYQNPMNCPPQTPSATSSGTGN